MSLLATSPPPSPPPHPSRITNPTRVDLDWVRVALELDRASDTVAKLHELPAGVHVDLFEFKTVRDIDESAIAQLERYLETNGNTPDLPRISGATRAAIRVDKWSKSGDKHADEDFARRVERILRSLIDLNNVTTVRLYDTAWYSVAPIIRPGACKLNKLILTRVTPDMLAHPVMRVPLAISIMIYTEDKMPVTDTTFNPRLTSIRTGCEFVMSARDGSAIDPTDAWKAFGVWYPSIHMIRGPHAHNRANPEDQCVVSRAFERGMAFKHHLPEWELEEMRNDPAGVPPRRWYSTMCTPHDRSLRLRPSLRLFADHVYPSALTPKMAEGLRSALTARFPLKVNENMHVWACWRVGRLIEISIRYPEASDILTDDARDVVVGGNVVDFILDHGVKRLGHDPDRDVARILLLLPLPEVITARDVMFLSAVASGSMESGSLRDWMIREGNGGKLDKRVQAYKLDLSERLRTFQEACI